MTNPEQYSSYGRNDPKKDCKLKWYKNQTQTYSLASWILNEQTAATQMSILNFNYFNVKKNLSLQI